MAKMFVHYSKTKAEFIAAGLPTTYNNSIVFIKGDVNGNGSCIYTHGSYFANFAEFLAAINYVKGINVGGQSYNAAAGGGYVAFGAKDPSTVAVNAGSNGIEIGLTDAFVNKVNDTASNLGTKDDVANSSGSAFARIANLAQLVSDLTGGSVDSIEGQISKAIDALRTEITGDLTDTTDAKTLEAINDELNAIDAKVKAIEDAGFIKIGDVTAEIAKLGGSANGGTNVKVTVASQGGEVSSVTVDETALDAALAGKANLDESGKIVVTQLPDYILGQVLFGGIIGSVNQSTSDATVMPSYNFKEKYGLDNSSIIITPNDFGQYEGVYFILGGVVGTNVNVLGIAECNTGDWIISTGSAWLKVDNTDAVASVAGLTGAITSSALAAQLAATGDVNELALKSEVEAVEVTASGDNTLITASVSNKRAVAVAPTTKLIDAVSKAEKAYEKPSAGIPKTDLASGVQESLGKADTAYQKPSTGIAKADLASDVQNVLSNAFTSTSVSTSTDEKYLKVDDESEENTVVIGIHANVKAVASAVSDETDGLASSKDVKTYVDSMWEWEEL